VVVADEEGDLMRWRIAALSLAVVAVAGAGTSYVVLHRSTTSTAVGGDERPVPARSTPLADLPASAPVPAAGRVARRLRSAVAAPDLGGGLAGVVLDGQTGRVLFTRHAARPLPPASTTKLLTAVAALETLGPGARLTTGVVRHGRSLVLIGGGDVTLATHAGHGYPRPATLTELATRTADAVGRSRRYTLSYDTRAWSGATSAPGWDDGYFTAGDVSRLSALELDEGRQTERPYVPRAADPAAQAAGAFAALLRKDGVRLSGGPAPGAGASGDLGVASVDSPPVAALVQRMLTVSDNDLAEALGRQVASRSGLPATFGGAARAVVGAVRRLGVPTAGVRLYDASGLSRLDRIPPRTLTAVLRFAVGRLPELAPVVAGLPVAGASGTLNDRYRHAPASAAAGVLRAKTGTLAGVNSLAGTVVDAEGRLLIFAFLTDRATDPTRTERALDRLAARLASCGCGHAAT
jgi:serine-type D-Ala-D-Ala carboxypeptidase/endopeptidase (penicillin-binding protein 4)